MQFHLCRLPFLCDVCPKIPKEKYIWKVRLLVLTCDFNYLKNLSQTSWPIWNEFPFSIFCFSMIFCFLRPREKVESGLALIVMEKLSVTSGHTQTSLLHSQSHGFVRKKPPVSNTPICPHTPYKCSLLFFVCKQWKASQKQIASAPLTRGCRKVTCPGFSSG